MFVSASLGELSLERIPSIDGANWKSLIPCQCVSLQGLYEHFHLHVLMLNLQVINKFQKCVQMVLDGNNIVFLQTWEGNHSIPL